MVADPDLTAALEAIELQLEALVARYDDPRCKRMLRAANQADPGRKPIDDRADVAEVLHLHESGRCRSLWDACLLVASKYYGNQVSIAKRLYRKAQVEAKNRSSQ